MIEWCGTSSFSFLEGVSEPADLFETAGSFGYAGLALSDRMGFYGAVQALRASEQLGQDFFYAPGIRLHFDSAEPLLVYPLHLQAYSRLCRFLSSWSLDGMQYSEKGLTPLPWMKFFEFLSSCSTVLAQDYVLISVPGRFYPWPMEEAGVDTRVRAHEKREATLGFALPPLRPNQTPLWLLQLAKISGQGSASALSLAWPMVGAPGSQHLLEWIHSHSERLQIPCIPTTLPLFCRPDEKEVCDAITAIRHQVKLADLGYLAQVSAERRLLESETRESRLRFFATPELIARTQELASRHHFSLRELKYRYPKESVPEGRNATEYLREQVFAGAATRYPQGMPLSVKKQIEHELKLVNELKYEDYFLTIHDVLQYAKAKKILFQGRGSAANSILCYCLGITAIDPVQMDLLFERFLSTERNQPPDIDVDFEHERREEVIQEIYSRYGRHRAAMVATTITMGGRMAFREVSKIFGLSREATDDIAQFLGREGSGRLAQVEFEKTALAILAKHGISLPLWKKINQLTRRVRGRPRHLGIHTGGFVLSDSRLDELCAIEPARMPNRTVVPWNKDDVDVLGWMKVDFLSLGMLTAIRKCFESLNEPLDLYQVPREDPAVYQALCRADTVGVFQVESRAQMSMLPRLLPKKFYDLVVEVAIVRPGPIQGGMVHPYLKRRQGLEKVMYEHPVLEPILSKTRGVSIFQEQVMKTAVAVAGFTPGEADQLRKVMSGAWRNKNSIIKLKDKLFQGMRDFGIREEYIERIYKQIEGFGDYGFPASHAASFAWISYVSVWLKVHRPAHFLVALLNSQPMGFYSPRALINDAERHGIQVLPVHFQFSDWESRVDQKNGVITVRLGFHLIQGLSKKEMQKVFAMPNRFERMPKPPELIEVWGVSHATVQLLIQSGALSQQVHDGKRRTRLWQLMDRPDTEQPVLAFPASDESAVPVLSVWDEILLDYQSTGYTEVSKHPARVARELQMVRKKYQRLPWTLASQMENLSGSVQAVGMLTTFQKPPTAAGVAFLTLEDETGFMNLILRPETYERVRLQIRVGSLLGVFGTLSSARGSALQVKELWNPMATQADDQKRSALYSRNTSTSVTAQ